MWCVSLVALKGKLKCREVPGTVDADPDGYWGYFDSSKALELWKEMHELEPKGNFIKAFYAYNIKDLDESIEILEKFANQAKEEGERYGHLLNT